MFSGVGDAYNVATTLIQLGRACAALGLVDDAATAWRQALGLCQAQRRSTEADVLRQRLVELARG
ncbi:hypothetical protein ALI144C_30720 [Actinosynnema sp. ALI-1.44]|nr:hypothetical protein ALI144C_30720 [Actinosynnema sp. ALI-1.44]